MKERWKFSKEKLVSVEEGLKSSEPAAGRSICSCDRFIQYTKLVLYIELILFVGWSSYTVWQVYNEQTEISSFYSSNDAFRDVEYSTVPTEVIKSSPFKDSQDTVDTKITTKNDLMDDDLIPIKIEYTNDQLNVQNTNRELDFDDNWDLVETTTNKENDKDLLKPSSGEEDKEIRLTIPRLDDSEYKEKESLDASESNDKENSEDSAVIELEFPHFWHIYQEKTSSLTDSSEAVSESKFGEGFEHLYESNEKDKSNDFSEFQQTSSEKEIEQLNEKEEDSFNSEDIPTSEEILNNLNKLFKSIESVRKDLHLGILNPDDFFESLENSKTDEPFDLLKSVPTLDSWEQSTESSIVLSDNTNEEESRPIYSGITTSEFDYIPKHYWGEEDEEDEEDDETFWTPTIDWSEWHSDTEMDSMNNSTDNIYTETTAAATNEENNDSVEHGRWTVLFKLPDKSSRPSQTENVDSEVFDATTDEEDASTVLDIPKRVFLKPFRMGSVDSEQETVQFGPRLKNEELTERELFVCTTQLLNGFQVMKCSDSSDTSDSKSVSSTEDHITFFDSEKEKVPDNMELFDENSDIHNNSMIDKSENELTEKLPRSEDLSVTSETSIFEISTPTSSTTKDSTVSPTESDLDLSHGQTETVLNDENDEQHKLLPEIFRRRFFSGNPYSTAIAIGFG